MSRAATKPPIDWTETLNEAALWHDFGDFIQWFHVQAPGLPDPDQQEYVEFQDNLSFMRSQAACLYFGLEADVEAINAKLKTVALTINAERCAGTRLPALLDMADGESILRQLFGGLLVQFAGYAADTLVSGCCNLYRCQ